jgi:hypothetical protein
MTAFALSAVVSIGLLAIMIYFAPAITEVLLHSGKPAHNLRGPIIISIIFGIVLIGLVFSILMSVVVHYHPWLVVESPVSTLLFSNGFTDAVVGLVFAAFFLHWISETHRFDAAETPRSPSGRFQPKPKKPKWLVLEGYLVLALFIVGSSDVIRAVFDRLNSVKAGAEGFELSLRPSATASAVNNQPDLTSQTASVSSASDSTFGIANIPGLDFLSGIDSMIERDQWYLVLYGGGTLDQHPAIPARASDKDTELLNFAKQFIAPLARCQTELWSATGSNPLSPRSYTFLEAPMHEFSDAVDYGVPDYAELNKIIGRVTAAYTQVAAAAIDEAFVKKVGLRHASADPRLQVKGNSRFEATQATDGARKSKCDDLRDMICPLGELRGDSVNFDPNQSHAPRWWGSLNETLICRYVDIITGDLNYDTRKFLSKQFFDALKRSYTDGQWAGKPYAALITASISSITGQNEAAAEEVDTWLQERLRDKNLNNWYDLRMRQVRAILTEYWITSDLVAASNASLEDFHLKQLGEIVWQLMDIPGYSEENNFWRAKQTAPSFSIDYAYVGDQGCDVGRKVGGGIPTKETQEYLAVLKYTQLTYMIKYIERAFKDRNFRESDDEIENVERMLKELNSVDLGCMSLFSPDPSKVGEQIAVTRAQIYRLNAMWRCYEYDGIEKALSKDEKKQKLSAALQAALAGLRILDESRNQRMIKLGDKDQLLAEKIKPSEVLQEYAKLKPLAEHLAQNLSALESD